MSWICFIYWFLPLQPLFLLCNCIESSSVVCLDVCLVGTISSLDPDFWSLRCPSGLVWGGVWSMMSEMQLLWAPQTADWAQTTCMLQSLSICVWSSCVCLPVDNAFVSNPHFHWPFQQLKQKTESPKFKLLEFGRNASDVYYYYFFSMSSNSFQLDSHMHKTISSSFCLQIHRDKDTLCSSVSQKRHSLSTGKITHPCCHIFDDVKQCYYLPSRVLVYLMASYGIIQILHRRSYFNL